MGVFIKSKKEKQEEADLKEYLDQIDKMNEEAEAEQGKFKITDAFKKDPEEEELKKYMSKEELIKEEKERREANVFSFITGGIFLAVMIVIGVLLSVFSYVAQDDLHKIHLTDLQNYYKDRYGTSTKIETIDYYCYQDKEHNKVCTDMIYALNTDNQVLVKLNDKYGDNISTGKYYEDYKKYLISLNPNLDLIYDSPMLTDMEFNPDYKKYTSLAKVMPANDTFNSLLSQKKLTVSDMIVYQGEIDIDGMKKFYENLTEESKFVFVKMNKGIPSNVKIITYDKFIDLYVSGVTYPDQGIVNYQLDPLVNNVSNIYVNKLTPGSIETLDDKYEFTNGYTINMEKGNLKSNNKEDKDAIPNYYLIMFDGLLNGDNLYEINALKEVEPASYKEYFSTYFGGKTYLVSNTSLSIGNKQKIQKGLFK